MPRDTLIDFFRDLITIRGDFLVFDDGYRRRTHTYEDVGRRGARLCGAARGRRPAQGRQSRVLGREPSGVDRLLLGLPARRHHRRARSTIARRRRFRARRCAGSSTRGCAGRRRGPASPQRRLRARHSSRLRQRGADLALRRSRLARRRPDAAVSPCTRDDIIQIIFTSGATAEPKGVVIRHRNVLANTVPVEREVMKYRALRAAVSSAPLRQPAAAQPHVRPVDGHEHSADGARDGDLHAQLQPARHRPADPVAPRVGAGLRAEDPRRAARARRARVSRSPRSRRPPASRFPAAGGATGGCIARSDSSSGRSSSAPRRCRRTSKSSGAAWDSP